MVMGTTCPLGPLSTQACMIEVSDWALTSQAAGLRLSHASDLLMADNMAQICGSVSDR